MKNKLKRMIFSMLFPNEAKAVAELEQKREENEQFMRTVIDSVPLLVSVTDYDGNYILANKMLADLNDTTVEQMEGKRNIDFVIDSDSIKFAEEHIIMNKEVIKTQKPKHLVDEIKINKNENTIYFQTSKYPLTIKGEANYVLGVSIDITEIRSTEKELRKVNAELEEFAYIASHDLQEPLRAVSSYCQLLKEKEYENVDEEGKKFFDYIIDSSFRMKTLIKDLLDYSRVGKKDKPFEKIDLKNLLQEVLYDFEYTIKETNANIIIENDLPDIYAIRFRIKQLLHNIISNSLKFKSKKDPIIRIGCCNNDSSHYWLFYIKDNGIGIDVKYYDHIFGVFRRLYSREEYPGTGIGLALCKRIIEAHGGEIWVKSDLKKGTSVYFTVVKSWAICND